MMILDKEKIKKIFVFSLSNIGDVVLTFPVIDILKRDFPQAQLDVAVGPKAVSLLQRNELINDVYIFNKQLSWKEQWQWVKGLRKNRYDLFVDLRNTMVPLLVGPAYRTSLFMTRLKNGHMLHQHLHRLHTVYSYGEQEAEKISLGMTADDRAFIDEKLLALPEGEPLIILSPGAADQNKRWPAANFAELCHILFEKYHAQIILAGDNDDKEIAQTIVKKLTSHPALQDWTGQTTLPRLGCLISKSVMVITNDSAPMHLASYLNAPTLALFGPTNPTHYGPWGDACFYIKKGDACQRCRDRKAIKPHTCMESIAVREVADSFSIENDKVIFKRI